MPQSYFKRNSRNSSSSSELGKNSARTKRKTQQAHGRTLSPLVQIGQLLTKLNNTLISYRNIDKLMTDVSRDELTLDQKAVVLKNGKIEITNLDYTIDETKILNQININLGDGEKLGIVGAVGSGKTSLLKHIIGYILPNSGTVLVSDYDIKNIPSKSLREHIGYCSQNIQLFSGSIYDNITAGLDNVSEEKETLEYIIVKSRMNADLLKHT